MTTENHYETVIVGGGLAGLYAAYQLRGRRVLVLEASERTGGRIRSHRMGNRWVNVGAHVYPNPESIMGALAEELGIEVIDIPGSLRGIVADDKIINPSRVEMLPFVLPMPMRQRLAFVRKGLKLSLAMSRFNRIEHRVATTDEERDQQRRETVDFEAGRTFAEFMNGVPAAMDPLIRALARRSAGEPEQVSAGAALMCLAHVMGPANAPGATARVMVGGTETVIEGLLAVLGNDAVRLSAPVTLVDATSEKNIQIDFESPSGPSTVTADTVIVATPAPIARKILHPMPPELGAGLDSVTYGAFLSVGIFTNETAPASTDHLYAITTPGKQFDFLFNHANPVHPRSAHRDGGAFMAYRGGPRAEELMNEPDEKIAAVYLAQFLEILPEYQGKIVEAHVQRWPLGTAYAAPGRNAYQSVLEAGHPDRRVGLAGDYFDPLSGMEQAVRAARLAVDRIKFARR
ncbi:flavin monoamine oxidase family protein [Saccharopolyspora spinosa]|uniref:Oxygen-dependent protoporphyrinogen oxidase n=1 Tax=Saccharopolyspora spinosa TaxID=60894 RepID=A0A2N3Y0P4_SACSN|nr:NAD(P)/FAD-dependent oxidoreductase [Saccharopolyspora spinosa]PKW16486.1 oxygen-dependent protoporphyrinogen oxidase [Saccharopolyspora spinosa]